MIAVLRILGRAVICLGAMYVTGWLYDKLREEW